MVYTVGIHLANFNLAPLAISRSKDQRRPNMMKPSKSKLVCRAQNKPLSDGTEVQGGFSRSLVYDNLVVASAAVGSALSALGAGRLDSPPELVGEKGEVAVATIKKENPYTNPILHPANSPVTGDLVPTRVWVFVNEEGVVTQVPSAG